jgi:hypothetical protein
MSNQQLTPHRVTKPIQLLAAWLVGLILTNSSFLFAATQFSPSWESSALVIASIANVPIFLFALFVLQTRFRAELQEDAYYSEYLSKKTSDVVRIERDGSLESRVELIERHVATFSLASSNSSNSVDWEGWRVGLNARRDDFESIRAALRAAGIPLSEVIGTNPDATLPSCWLISLSKSLPLKHQVALLRALSPFQFDGFLRWNPEPDAGETEDVYIGSYGGGEYATINSELHDLLSGDVDELDLKRHMERFKSKAPS